MAAIERIFSPRLHDIGGLTVGRVLPFAERRMVGPFIFLDHMGPAEMAPGQALDVRPHPHIGLSTLTYLFEGEIFHRDNLGNALEISPGAVNWMTAGRGIAHSERTPVEKRSRTRRLHGLQCWVALPKAEEEIAPAFQHYGADSIPRHSQPGVSVCVVAGEAFGLKSPIETHSPLFYAEVLLDAGATITLAERYPERAVYSIEGNVTANGIPLEPRSMAVFEPRGEIAIKALSAARLMFLGGEPFLEPRHIWWNFVSSSKARIEQAKKDWREGRFARIPGDDREFIPLPDQ